MGEANVKKFPCKILVSPVMWRYIGLSFHFGSLLAGVPFKWDGHSWSVIAGSTYQRRLWGFNMFIALGYALFVYGRCLQISLDENESNHQKIYMRVMSIYMTLAVVLHVNIMMTVTLLPSFVNYFLRRACRFEQTYLANGHVKAPLMQVLMTLLVEWSFKSINGITMLMTVNAFLRPMSPEQLPSMLPFPPNLPVRMLSAIVIGYIEYIYHASSFAIIVAVFPFTALVLTNINELRIFSANYRQLRRKLATFRETAIEVRIFNGNFGTIIVPGLKFLGILIVIYCAFAGLRMRGIQALALGFLGAFMILLLLIVFSFLAEFHHRSSKILMEWASALSDDVIPTATRERFWLAKSLKSFQPVKCQLGSLYYVDRRMVLTMASIIIANTVNFFLVNQ